MIRREFILETLALLELWYWPVFFWNLARLKAYIAARKAEGGDGLVGYGVTRTGRIIITLDFRGDRPDPNDWTRHAPRAPWEKLDPEARHAALMARCGEALALSVLIGALTAQGPTSAHLTALHAGLPHILAPP